MVEDGPAIVGIVGPTLFGTSFPLSCVLPGTVLTTTRTSTLCASLPFLVTVLGVGRSVGPVVRSVNPAPHEGAGSFGGMAARAG